MSNVSQIINQFEATRSAYKNELQELFTQKIQEFFETNPWCESLAWVQYTPYFNDGEPCEFGVGDVVIHPFMKEEDKYEDSDYYRLNEISDEEASKIGSINPDYVRKAEWSESYYYIEYQNIPGLDDITQITNQEEVMLDMFGDHVGVVCTKDGCEVEEYDHD